MARKVISIITPHYSPEITAAAHRMEIVAKVLSSSYRVHVFTLMEKGTRSEDYDTKFGANLTVHYLSQKNFNKNKFFSRAIFESWYALKLVRASNSVNADLTIVTVPYIFLLPFAAWFCTTGKKIADIRDLVWNYLPAKGWLHSRVKKYLTRFMHRALRKFDSITLTNEAEKRWMIRNGFSPSTLTVIPNGLSSDKFRQLTEVLYNPHPKKLTITYLGNVGSSQDFLRIIDTVNEMKDVRLNIIGDGNDYTKLRNYIDNKRITNVALTGKLKWRRALPYYQGSDILFASLRENFDTAIPSKLYEYLATGLPIIFQGSGAAADFIRNFENAFVVNTLHTTEIEKIIWKLKETRPNRSQKNIREVSRYFIREKLSKRFVELSALHLNEPVISDVFVDELLDKLKIED